MVQSYADHDPGGRQQENYVPVSAPAQVAATAKARD
jgi:hypothetical protein